jgi:hypothetical protein
MTQTAKQEHSNFTMAPNVLIDGFDGLSDSFRFGYLRFVRLFGKRGFFCGSIRKLGKMLKVARMTINRMVAAWVKYGLITEEPGEESDQVLLILQAENLWQENTNFYAVTKCDAPVTEVDHTVTRRDKGVTKIGQSVTASSSKSAVIYKEDSNKITEDKSEEHPPYVAGYTGEDTTHTSDSYHSQSFQGTTSNPPHGGPFEDWTPEKYAEMFDAYAPDEDAEPSERGDNGLQFVAGNHLFPGDSDGHSPGDAVGHRAQAGQVGEPATGEASYSQHAPQAASESVALYESDHDTGGNHMIEDEAAIVQAEAAYPLPDPVVVGGKRNGKVAREQEIAGVLDRLYGFSVVRSDTLWKAVHKLKSEQATDEAMDAVYAKMAADPYWIARGLKPMDFARHFADEWTGIQQKRSVQLSPKPAEEENIYTAFIRMKSRETEERWAGMEVG